MTDCDIYIYIYILKNSLLGDTLIFKPQDFVMNKKHGTFSKLFCFLEALFL